MDMNELRYPVTVITSLVQLLLVITIISNYDGKKYIVDGQQRLTTLTLLLIRLYHLLEDETQKRRVEPLIHSLSGGKESFNLDVHDWLSVMNFLYPKEKQEKESFDNSNELESVVNIVSRYNDIKDNFEFHGQSLLYFVDWLLENVYLVEIVAYNTRDAYAIFETVNDRGLSLTPSDMLRGYVLSKSEDFEFRDKISEVWRDATQTLRSIGKNEESEAIKAWLRSQYAQNVTDFDEIGSEFHRWVRDQEQAIGLKTSDNFANFIVYNFDFYSGWYYRLRQAARSLKPRLECVFYNAQNNFTLQYPILLSPLCVGNTEEEILQKIQIVSTYLDILIHRRIWNNQDISQRTMADQIFPLIPSIRAKKVDQLRDILYKRIHAETKPFSENNIFGLHGGNRRKIFLILARMTDFLEVQSDQSTRYMEYMRTGKNRYEIEHIWTAHPDPKFLEMNSINESDFFIYRNRIGGLLLLPKSDNASIGDDPYRKKLNVYAGQNLLAQSLHEVAYLNKPGFRRFRETSGLNFKKHDNFNKKDLEERHQLYLKLAEKIWNPDRLKTDSNTELVNVGKPKSSPANEDNDLESLDPENDCTSYEVEEISTQKAIRDKIRKFYIAKAPEKVDDFHRQFEEFYVAKFSTKVEDFCKRIEELLNLIEEELDELTPNLQQLYFAFNIGNRRAFGVHIDCSPPKFVIWVNQEDANQLKNQPVFNAYYPIRRCLIFKNEASIEALRPILKSVYTKLRKK